MQVVEGRFSRTVGEWEPFVWLSNGDLFAHTPDDSSGMGVYRPDARKFVRKTDSEWGDSEFGLGGVAGHNTGRDVVLHLLGSHGKGGIGVYDLGLRRKDLIELPKAPGKANRLLQSPVRVGKTTMVTYRDMKRTGYVDPKAVFDDGVLVIRGDSVKTVLKGRHVERLVLSTDGTAVVAILTAKVNGFGDTEDGYGPSQVVELDPRNGRTIAELGSPPGYEKDNWTVDRADKVGSLVGIQVSVDCTEVLGESPARRCGPIQTWQSDGTSWTKVPGTTGREVYWQSPSARVSWTYQSEAEAQAKSPDEDGSLNMYGPIEYDVRGKHEVLAPKTAYGRVAAGSLLKPKRG